MTEIYSNRSHSDIPKRVRSRISANVEDVIEKLGDNPDHQEEMIEDLIDIAYDAYHVGWQSGFIDDTQEDPALTDFRPNRDESIMEALEKLKKTIDESTGRQRGLAFFNPGGTK